MQFIYETSEYIQLEISTETYTIEPVTPKKLKHPPNAFLLYLNSEKDKIKSVYPEVSNKDINYMVSQQWQKMSEEEKKKYKDEAARLLNEFKKQNSADAYIIPPRRESIKSLIYNGDNNYFQNSYFPSFSFKDMLPSHYSKQKNYRRK